MYLWMTLAAESCRRAGSADRNSRPLRRALRRFRVQYPLVERQRSVCNLVNGDVHQSTSGNNFKIYWGYPRLCRHAAAISYGVITTS